MNELSNSEWNDVQEAMNNGVDAMRKAYSDPDNENEVVVDDGDVLVCRDIAGDELDMVAEHCEVDRDALAKRMRREARHHTRCDWSADEPAVVYING